MNERIGNDLCNEIITQAINEMKEAQGETFSMENICFLQVQIPKSCKQKWRNLHLRFGESCRLCGIAAAALQTCY